MKKKDERKGKNIRKSPLKKLFLMAKLTLFLMMLVGLMQVSATENSLKTDTRVEQVKGVSGKVIDQQGDPLPGVTVVIKGTTRGTVTDIDGQYNIPEASANDILQFSFVGMISQDIKVNEQKTINITLLPDAIGIEEVVAIGYGVQRKSDVTGAVGSVKEETLKELPAANLNQSLKGQITGVNVTTNSGRPGGKTNIRVRGNTSVSVSNNPLYVIDGVILIASGMAFGSTPIDYINPSDIASVEVLKDASATAIYGARGANGVILVTTKRGTAGGAKISYDNYFSTTTLPHQIEMLNSEEFLRVEDIAFTNAEKYDPVGYAAGKYVDPATKRTNPNLFQNGKPIYDTNWQDEVTKSGLTQSHQLSFQGGNANTSFGAFVGYLKEDGLMKESSIERLSGRIVLDSQMKDWIKVGGSISFNKQTDQLLHGGTSAGWVGRNMLEYLPIIPVKYPDGTWGENSDYPGMEGGPNPVRVGQEYLSFLKTTTVLADLYASITLTKGLELRTTVGINDLAQNRPQYGGRNLAFISKNQFGRADIAQEQHTSWQFENYLTYNKSWDKQSLTGVLGVSWQHVDYFSFWTRVDNFTDDFYTYNNLGAGSVRGASGSRAYAYGLQSFFGRFNYTLNDKYLVTVTGRADGSSKFGEDNRYAFFPSAALAWRASEEDFIKDISAISNLKLRTSYGVTGNSEITVYQALAGMSNYSYIFNKNTVAGTGVGRLANPELQWEKTKQFDVGLELGLFDGRLSFEADVYHKLTSDMLLNSPVPASSGYTVVARNIGSMVNKGFEFQVGTLNVKTNNFSWETIFNISINKNEVTALSGGSDIFSGANIIRVGYPVSTYFGLHNLGTWNSDQAEEAAKYGKEPGDIRHEDINNDGKINLSDRIIMGKGIPDGFGLFKNSFRYKNLDLMVDIQYQYGNDMLFRAQHSLEDRQGIANSFRTVLDAWTPENQNTRIAQLRPIAAGYDTNQDSGEIYDGSFIRGRNMVLGYNFSQKITNKLHLSKFRVYASVQNFFVITSFPGFDPESQTSGNTFGQGYVSYDEYPKPRVFMFGLNVSL